MQALDDDAGGQQCLAEQATKNPAAFWALLARVLPLTLVGDASEPLTVCVTNYSSPDDQRRDE